MSGARGVARVLIGLVSMVAACEVPQKSISSQRQSMELAVGNLLNAQNGVVLLFNPATCAFSSSIGAQLADIARDSKLKVLVVFFGVSADSASDRRTRSDFNLRGPSQSMTAKEAQGQFAVPEGGIPTLLVLKRGKLVLISHGSALISLNAWLPRFLGVHDT